MDKPEPQSGIDFKPLKLVILYTGLGVGHPIFSNKVLKGSTVLDFCIFLWSIITGVLLKMIFGSDVLVSYLEISLDIT